MRAQFASGRSQLPFSISDVAVSGGGALTTPRTLYFALQGENPAGLNLLSEIVGPIALAAGQQITITLPPAIHEEGEYWLDYVLSASESAAPETFAQVAKIPADRLALPQSFILSRDEHLKLSQSVASAAALPSGADLVNGMMRGVGAFVYEYDDASTLEPAGEEVLAAVTGRWIRKSVTFSTYLEDTTDYGGCDRAIADLDPSTVRTPRYSCNGSNSIERVFWIRPSLGTLPAGDRVGVAVNFNDVPQSGLFEGMLRLTFRGYSDTLAGTLRTQANDGLPFFGVDEEIIYDNERSDLVLPDELNETEAYTLAIAANFRPQYLRHGIANNTIISVEPFLYSQTGARVEAGWALGDWIYPVEGQYSRVCLPGASNTLIAEKGSGLVARRSFLAVGPTEVTGLASDTADQEVRLNGNGSVYVAAGDRLSTEATRCYVGTLAGTGTASPWSAAIAVNGGQGLSITCTYPMDGGYGRIRANYPDPSIAGLARARLNPPQVTLYAESTVGGVATIRRFTGLPLTEGTTQVFALSDWSAGEIIGVVPVPGDPYFGLFEAVSTAVVASGAGNFPSGSIRVAYAFQYDGLAVSAIDHQRIGCIHQGILSLAEIEKIGRTVAPAVATFAELRSVPAAQLWPNQRRYVTEADRDYRWAPTLTTADDGSTIIRPDHLSADQPGRFVQIVSTGGGGTGIQVAADAATLRSQGAGTEGEVWYASWLKDLMIFDPGSTAADDGLDVIKLDTTAAEAEGRFISQTRRILSKVLVSGGDVATASGQVVWSH